MKVIEARNLSFSYSGGSRAVIDGADFSIEEGTVNLLIGLNGSGKTTLIRILAGLIRGYGGEVLLHGRSLKDIAIPERSRLISYVSQRSDAIGDYLVEEYLLFARVGRHRFLPSEEDKAIMLRYAEEFGITKLLDRKIDEISGGERQIVAICSAMIQESGIIILDEPTSALDIKNQNVVLSIIKRVAERDGKTVILSSHNPNHALFLSSNVILVDGGRVESIGDAKDGITVERLSAVYGESICYSADLPYKEITFKPL